MFKSMITLAAFAVSCTAVAAPGAKQTTLKHDQYLVSRSSDTYVFVDKGVIFSGAADAQQPKPTTGGPVYVISKTPEGLIANRLIILSQCSIPYGVTIAAQDILNKTGKPVEIKEFSTKYDASPVWQVKPSSRFGKVWSAMCNNTWNTHQHWGELRGEELIEKVARRTGEHKFIVGPLPRLSFDITTQNTQDMSKVLSDETVK